MSVKKNDIVVAKEDFVDWLTKGKRYTVLGVKTLPSGEIVFLVSLDIRRRQYMDAKLFMPLERALTEEEKQFRERLEGRDL